MAVYKYTNRLVNEKSPYLLQHAHNPVDWYPWGEEAFMKARLENKPVFLSIGYSTCHWCHVMERESFAKEDVAAILNQYFVSIKVDREERPDLDTVYMEACQLLTQHGGWPLNVFLTPDGKPFYAGTYFPRQDMMGAPGFLRLLKAIAEVWEKEQDKILASAETVVEELIYSEEAVGFSAVGKEVCDRAYDMYVKIFDPVYGGFGQAPKFPAPHHLLFLLDYGEVTGQKYAAYMAEKTLKSMFMGGIYDHIGGGFCRYATDQMWLIPHFEKMLSDNALLAITYLKACRVTGESFYLEVAGEIIDYVLREMAAQYGGFFTAEDAETEGEEGKFYLWDLDEIVEVLGPEEAERFANLYGITKGGNFEGRNIPNLIAAGEKGIKERQTLKWAREKLFTSRESRVRPFKDDKILTGVNGLMIAALALGSCLKNEPVWKEKAEKTADFVLRQLRRPDGRLLASYRHSPNDIPAFLDDYAFFIWGILELYEATLDDRWLKTAMSLTHEMISLFWNEERGGFYYTGHDAEKLFKRPQVYYDAALPSGNSVAAHVLVRLSRLTGEARFGDMVARLLASYPSQLIRYPIGYSHMLSLLLYL